MPTTDSEPGGERYRFAFSWEGPYGHAVHLVERHAPAGLVLDLGCGYAAIAEALADRGRAYVGGDRDTDAVKDLISRGFEGHVVDLAASDGLAEHLADLLSGRAIGALLLLDILEHLAEPASVLAELSELFRVVGNGQAAPPVLVTSIPNVAHFDLAAKLLAGRWDVTPTGLLDRTHLQMFTESRVDAELGRFGWRECGREDVILERSDQWFPLDHPFLVEGGTVHDHLWALRAAADPQIVVNQFVRAYSFAPAASPRDSSPQEPRDEGDGAPFLSVLTRTQGIRLSMLAESLTCLAAQTRADLEVVVLVHSDCDELVDSCRAVVESFEEGFVARVRVEQVRGGSRAAPLNAGLALARGRYVAFLDDDDLVTADWAERFAEAAARAPGKLVRSVCHARHVRQAAPEETAMGTTPVTLTRPVGEFGKRFDAVLHLAVNLTPILSFAVPRALVTELGLAFDDRLAVCEDWDLLLRAALLVGVEDTGQITSIYQRWDDEGTTTAEAGSEVWSAAHARMLAALDSAPLLLPPGSASTVAHLVGDPGVAVLRDAEGAARERRGVEAEQLRLRFAELEARLAEAEHARDEMLQSEFWRMTAPVRALVTRLRRGREKGA
ncbi:MAG: glycosyltransferase [Acidimicrobiales bacterium]